MYQIHCKTPNENPRIHIFLEKVENYRSRMGIYSIGLDFKKMVARKIVNIFLGVQWFSGRVLDSRPRSSGLELHRRHCVVVLEQDTFILA